MSLMFWIVLVAIACVGIWRLLRWFDLLGRAEVYTPEDEDRDLATLGPYFRRDVVEAKVKSLFPSYDPAEILRLLHDVPSFWKERMQLNILKLSDGDLDRLRHYIRVAKSQSGFMTVIDLAEYPESSQMDIDDPKLGYSKHKRQIERDFRQYLNWLKKK